MSENTGQSSTPMAKAVLWVLSSRKDVKEFPKEVREDVGLALQEAAEGSKSSMAKVLAGFGGASVLEVVSNYDTDTYRAVYTVRFARAIVVLHCFQKKSKRGSETTLVDKKLIEKRLKDAKGVYDEWLKEQDS